MRSIPHNAVCFCASLQHFPFSDAIASFIFGRGDFAVQPVKVYILRIRERGGVFYHAIQYGVNNQNQRMSSMDVYRRSEAVMTPAGEVVKTRFSFRDTAIREFASLVIELAETLDPEYLVHSA